MTEHVTIIEKKKSIQLVAWRELVAYKDLLYFLIFRGIKARYAQSVLGVGWAIIQPLFTMLVFTIVFGGLAKVSSDGAPYALFSLSGLVAWNFFSAGLSDSAASLVNNAGLLGKVYFPRLVLPLSGLLTKFLDFAISLFVLAVLLIIFRFTPSWQLIFFPLLVLLLFIVTLGPSLLVAAWSVQYRDVKYAMTFIVQILLYAAPVVYPLSLVPEHYRFLYSFNPMVGVVEGFRASLLGTTPMPWMQIGFSGGVGCIILMYGLFIFSRLEKTFADVV